MNDQEQERAWGKVLSEAEDRAIFWRCLAICESWVIAIVILNLNGCGVLG